MVFYSTQTQSKQGFDSLSLANKIKATNSNKKTPR